MFVGICNTPRDYAWGARDAITALLGEPPTGGPEAELWLGAHSGSPAHIVNPAAVGGARTLEEWIGAEPARALGSHPRLPFLLKVLAADSPLSLQAHPTVEQAHEGFARENTLGIALDAPHRNYTDPYPKVEILYALSSRFEVLCGFREVADTHALLRSLDLHELSARLAEHGLRDTVGWLISRGDGVDALVDRVSALPSRAAPPDGTVSDEAAFVGTASPRPVADDTERALILDTVRLLAAAYPTDPGIVVALLLNRVSLRRGEALYLPAGNIHAYLNGVGIELMNASDNVLRGGLTPKHVDGDELLRVLDFTPTAVPYVRPVAVPGATQFHPDGLDFGLTRVTGAANVTVTGPAIALCTVGSSTLTGAHGARQLRRGEAVYITPDEAQISFSGEGEVFLATTI